jgi:hypothetical protein
MQAVTTLQLFATFKLATHEKNGGLQNAEGERRKLANAQLKKTTRYNYVLEQKKIFDTVLRGSLKS